MESNFDFIDSDEKIIIIKHGFNKKRRNVTDSLKLGKSIREIFDDFFIGQYWENLLLRRTKLMDFDDRADYISVAYEVCDSLHSLFERRFERNPEKYAVFMSEIRPKILLKYFGFDARGLEHIINIIYPDMPFIPDANFYYQGENPLDKFFKKSKNKKPELYSRPRTISRIIEFIYHNRIEF